LFRDSRESSGGEPSTLGKVSDVHEADHEVRREFWVNWKLGARTKGKRLTTLRGFFRFCLHRKWIAESRVSPDIKPPKGVGKEANSHRRGARGGEVQR